MTYLVTYREIEQRLDRRPSYGRTHKWPLRMSNALQDRRSRHKDITIGIDERPDEVREDLYWTEFDRGYKGRHKIDLDAEQSILMVGY